MKNYSTVSKKQLFLALSLFLVLPLLVYAAMQVINTRQEAGVDTTNERVVNGNFTGESYEVKYSYPKGVSCPTKDF